jgi:hypothetical protein
MIPLKHADLRRCDNAMTFLIALALTTRDLRCDVAPPGPGPGAGPR